jgi:hypothetical protein
VYFILRSPFSYATPPVGAGLKWGKAWGFTVMKTIPKRKKYQEYTRRVPPTFFTCHL